MMAVFINIYNWLNEIILCSIHPSTLKCVREPKLLPCQNAENSIKYKAMHFQLCSERVQPIFLSCRSGFVCILHLGPHHNSCFLGVLWELQDLLCLVELLRFSHGLVKKTPPEFRGFSPSLSPLRSVTPGDSPKTQTVDWLWINFWAQGFSFFPSRIFTNGRELWDGKRKALSWLSFHPPHRKLNRPEVSLLTLLQEQQPGFFTVSI